MEAAAPKLKLGLGGSPAAAAADPNTKAPAAGLSVLVSDAAGFDRKLKAAEASVFAAKPPNEEKAFFFSPSLAASPPIFLLRAVFITLPFICSAEAA